MERTETVSKIKDFQLLGAVNKNHIKAALCRKSYSYFVREFWDEIIPETCVWNWHMEYICDELQKVAMRVIQRKPKLYDLILNVPPGSSKSTIATRMLSPWVWCIDPTLRFIHGSFDQRLVLEHADDSRDLIWSDKYREYFPEIQIRKDRELKSNYKIEYTTWDSTHQNYVVRSGGNRFSCSVGSNVTGHHAHIIVVDDPLNPKKAASEVELKSANEWMNQTLSTRKVNKKIVPTILIMQRLHEDDPTGNWVMLHRVGNKKIRHICLPGEDRYPIKPASLKQYYVDGLLDPVRLDREVLGEMEVELGQYGYAGQVGQQPTPPSGGKFDVNKFRVVNTIPFPIRKVVRYWDKAATDGEESPDACWTVGCRMAVMENGQFIVLDVCRGQWATDKREEYIRQCCIADGKRQVTWIEQEPGSGGKDSALSTIKGCAGYVVRADRPTGNKTWRADPWSVQVNNGNVYLLHSQWVDVYVNEHKYFPFSKFKDQVDASSGAFSKLVNKKRAGSWGKQEKRSE